MWGRDPEVEKHQFRVILLVFGAETQSVSDTVLVPVPEFWVVVSVRQRNSIAFNVLTFSPLNNGVVSQ